MVFNIAGNKFRLITSIAYASRPEPGKPQFKGKVFVLHVLTHEDYGANKWKTDCGC